MTTAPSREALAAAAAGFARYLRQERELRGLARQDVERLTRLPPALIEALESGDADRMPPKAYVFGYLRAYAGAVGLDADDVVLRWQEVVGPEEHAAPRVRVPVVRAAVALAVAAALAFLAALTLFGPSQRPAAPRKAPAAQTEQP